MGNGNGISCVRCYKEYGCKCVDKGKVVMWVLMFLLVMISGIGMYWSFGW